MQIPVTVIPDELVADMHRLTEIFMHWAQANRGGGYSWTGPEMVRLIKVARDTKYWEQRIGIEHGYLGDECKQEG